MTWAVIFSLAVVVVVVLAVGSTIIGATLHSAPWLVIGGWLGVAVVVDLTWRKP